MMTDVMSSYILNDKKNFELILNIILQASDGLEQEKNLLKLVDSKSQHSMRGQYGKRSVILDGYGEKADGTMYDIEIQRSNSGASLKRARYNGSVMDVNSLMQGQDFSELPDRYVIFITENDIFHKDLPIYHIIIVVKETGEEVDMGVNTIYINTSYCDCSTDIGKLIHDFKCSNPNDMYYKELADSMRYYKMNTKGVNIMYNTWNAQYLRGKREEAEKLRKKIESLEKSIELKNNEKLKIQYNFARHLLFQEKLDIEEVAKKTELSVDEVRALISNEEK